MVGTFAQPDFETQGGTEYKNNIDNSIAAISDWGASFAPHEQSTPNMTIQLDAGTIFDGTDLIVLSSLNTGTITAPATNPRKDIVYIDPTGGGGSPLVYIGVQTGSEAASPADPSLSAGLIPIARINLTTSTTAIANTDIDDLRGVIWDQSSGSGNSAPDDSTLEDTGSVLQIKDAGVVTAKLADNAVTLAKMAGGTDGTIITYDANGDPVAVGPGTSAEVLTSNGAGAPPSFQAMSQILGGGISIGTPGVTVYLPFGRGSDTDELECSWILPYACTFDDLFCELSNAAGTGESYIFTLRKNTADTALTATIAGASDTTGSDTSNEVSFAQGDSVTMKLVVSGSAAAAGLHFGVRVRKS